MRYALGVKFHRKKHKVTLSKCVKKYLKKLKTAVSSNIKQIMLDIGQSMLKGVLSSRGIEIPTVMLRECLAELDPINAALRSTGPISRRAYSVPHPNALWHMDGNHKLIRYITSMPLAMSISSWVHWLLLYRFLILLSWTFNLKQKMCLLY